MIVGIVLAAGRSRRMGRPKPLLEIDGESFLARAVHALRGGGCEEVIVVTSPNGGPGGRSIAEAARAQGARVAVNQRAGSEQIDSLRAGMAAAPAAEAIVVLPVDVPIRGSGTVSALIQRFRETGAPVVLPRHAGGRGHPVLFARAAFGDLRSGDLGEGARTVIGLHERGLVEVPVDDPTVLLDVDTPDDYRRLLQAARDPR